MDLITFSRDESVRICGEYLDALLWSRDEFLKRGDAEHFDEVLAAFDVHAGRMRLRLEELRAAPNDARFPLVEITATHHLP